MTSPKRRRQRRESLLQPLPVAVDVEQTVQLVEAVDAVPAAPAAVEAVVTAFEVGAGQPARPPVGNESAVASGPPGCHRLESASWNRARCPRSSRLPRRSQHLGRSSSGIEVSWLWLPR